MNETHLMPFIGGPADGYWAYLPELPNSEIRSDDIVYVIHVLCTDNGAVLWFACEKHRCAHLLGDDVLRRYYPEMSS